jgi:hypothetical protein
MTTYCGKSKNIQKQHPLWFSFCGNVLLILVQPVSQWILWMGYGSRACGSWSISPGPFSTCRGPRWDLGDGDMPRVSSCYVPFGGRKDMKDIPRKSIRIAKLLFRRIESSFKLQNVYLSSSTFGFSFNAAFYVMLLCFVGRDLRAPLPNSNYAHIMFTSHLGFLLMSTLLSWWGSEMLIRTVLWVCMFGQWKTSDYFGSEPLPRDREPMLLVGITRLVRVGDKYHLVI